MSLDRTTDLGPRRQDHRRVRRDLRACHLRVPVRRIDAPAAVRGCDRVAGGRRGRGTPCSSRHLVRPTPAARTPRGPSRSRMRAGTSVLRRGGHCRCPGCRRREGWRSAAEGERNVSGVGNQPVRRYGVDETEWTDAVEAASRAPSILAAAIERRHISRAPFLPQTVPGPLPVRERRCPAAVRRTAHRRPCAGAGTPPRDRRGTRHISAHPGPGLAGDARPAAQAALPGGPSAGAVEARPPDRRGWRRHRAPSGERRPVLRRRGGGAAVTPASSGPRTCHR